MKFLFGTAAQPERYKRYWDKTGKLRPMGILSFYLCRTHVILYKTDWMVQAVNGKIYEYESLLYEAGDTGGAYVIFPYDIRKEFGRGRVKVHATFDGEPYDGSVVNMGVKNADGSVCYIIGVRKDIRSRIGKQPGDSVQVTVRERE